MRIRQKIISLVLGGTVLLGMAGAAMAAPAVATSNVNVRSGPGGGYGVVDTLRRNEVVDVTGCRGGWCYVEKRGPDGWVSSSYLQTGRQGYPSSKPSVSFSFNFGTPPAPPRPPRHDNDGWGGGHQGGWDGHNGGWDRDRDRDGPRRPRDWN